MQFPIVPGIDFDTYTVSLILAIFFVGGLCKGAIGFGLPIIVISLLSMFLPVSFSVALNIIPPFILNFWQATHKAPLKKNFIQLFPIFIGLFGGIVLGTTFIVGLSPNLLLGLVGGAILIFCANSVWGTTLTIPKNREKPYGLFVGVLCGILGGLTSVSVPPLLVFLSALRLDKDRFVSILGLYFVVVSASLIVAFSTIGLLNETFIPFALTCTAITAVGMWCGQKFRNRLDQKKFYNAVTIVLVLISLNLLRRAFF